MAKSIFEMKQYAKNLEMTRDVYFEIGAYGIGVPTILKDTHLTDVM